MVNIYAERIQALRAMMRSRNWDAVVIMGSDPHASEYPAERYKQVQWLTGFSGEAGDLVVTLDHAGLWTDTRYFIQANLQLDGTGVELHKTRIPEQVLIPEWLSQHFKGESNLVITVDGISMDAQTVQDIADSLIAAGIDHEFISSPDFLNTLWKERPAIPQTPIYTIQPGCSRTEKLQRLRNFCSDKQCDGILLSALDDIAWTLNVRASDIEYNPLVISYLLVTQEDACWCVLKEPIEDPDTEATFSELSEDGIRLARYDEIEEILSDCSGMRIFTDASINYHLSKHLQLSSVEVLNGSSPVQLMKAVKNTQEIEGMRKAHLLDGAAMELFLYWLEKSLDADRKVSEWDAAVKLGQYRSDIEGYMGDSFETISAYGAGAALPHYVTPKNDAPLLESHGLYLCDSGCQFASQGENPLYGTTDITRTVPLGDCTPLEREDYTLVLKSHIDLAKSIFPAGTAGCQLDAVAREPLWASMRNFGHGTGHGVGSLLGVHEGPQDMRQNFNRQPLLPGMILSDEPGIYREGMHGVRHENLLLCVDAGSNEFGHWNRFETLTLCHFDTTILDLELLDKSELAWLNEYNSRVFNTLAPLLPEPVAQWLEIKCAPVG